ncbi:MAG: hypothetical protein IPK75_04585 [Acidobacteria bacterium]|nr:hypothetical protein [Acidobacteriota bacterium]
MYPLFDRKAWVFAMTLILLFSVALFSSSEKLNLSLSDWRVASLGAAALIACVTLSVGKHWHLSPWRFVWRTVPALNRWVFPDINGVWVGTWSSNWPKIQMMSELAQSQGAIEAADLDRIAEQEGRIVLEIRASFFSVRINAYSEQTRSHSKSLTARPIRCPDDQVRLVYVYLQEVSDPQSSDDSVHLGAAELEFHDHDLEKADGIYWTRRKWKQGLNTAGKIDLRRVSHSRSSSRSLKSYL